jgi:hypothetical protein
LRRVIGQKVIAHTLAESRQECRFGTLGQAKYKRHAVVPLLDLADGFERSIALGSIAETDDFGGRFTLNGGLN